MYKELGVDSDKSDIAKTFDEVNDNDFPNAFCNMLTDPKNSDMLIIKHADGVGSKSVQRYLHYLQTGDKTIFQGDIFDAVSMNTGDIAAVGAVFCPYIATNTTAINAINVNKNLIKEQFAIGIKKIKELYRKYCFDFFWLGGETADLPDQTSSYILDVDIYTRVERQKAIIGNVEHDDIIFGFSSGGRAIWEEKKNSGQMSNGLTMNRIALMHSDYTKKYPFLFRNEAPCRGKYEVYDYLDDLGMTVSDALTCPTRQWAIVVKMLIEELEKNNALHLLHGMCMNTGGGNTKIKNIGNNIKYVKILPKPLPLFRLVQSETGESWKNMYQAQNMGIGFEVVGSAEGGFLKNAIEEVSKKTNVRSYLLGKCYNSPEDKNQVVLDTDYGIFEY
ncbi:hypothetical protein ACFL23_00055 [Patescibacteria group bacterium]